MNNSNFDPDRIHQRRLIINVSIIAVVLILALAGWLHITHYHRTTTDKQQALMSDTEPVVVMFYSTKCSDCKKVARTVNKNASEGQLADTLKAATGDNSKQHKVMFLEYQNKHDRQLFYKYNVTATPTFMVLKQGQPQVIKNENGVPAYQYVGNTKAQIKSIYHNLQAIPLMK